MDPLSTPLPRRSFLVGAGSLALVSACGSNADPSVDAEVAAGGDTGGWLLQPGFADGFRVPPTLAAGGTERAPFVLYGSDGIPAVNDIPETIAGELTGPDGTAVAVTLTRHGAGVPVPYYPLRFDAPDAGVYVLQAEVGGEAQRTEFQVAEADSLNLIRVGDPLRPVDTPTFDDARGYDPICTRFDPCPFHEVNLADAIGNGQPTTLLIATPGFCQTAVCGPVVELLMDGQTAGNVIHAEVYTEPGRLGEVADFTTLVGPVVKTYGMDFEPSIVVADADGIVTARLDYTWDRDDLDAALTSARG